MTKKKSGSGLQLGTILALVLMCVFLAIANKDFYTPTNIMGILKQATFNRFLATGMLLCLITAGIDLSVGANANQPYDTDAIAACIIGGASFTGGKGAMFGTMLGCLIIAVLRNGFTLLAIDTAVQNIALGLIIILAVLMDVIRAQTEAKRRRLAAGK